MSPRGTDERAPSSAPLDEATLVSRIAAGDERAFEHLVRTYTVVLVHFAAGYIRDPDAAEEIVEDVFFRIWELREGWHPKSSLRAYLFTAVRNRALDWLKHVAAEERGHDRWRREIANDPAVSVAWQESDHREEPDALLALQQALAMLTDRQREALRLRYEERLSYREVASVMEISESAVDRLLSRAVQALRRVAREKEK